MLVVSLQMGRLKLEVWHSLSSFFLSSQQAADCAVVVFFHGRLFLKPLFLHYDGLLQLRPKLKLTGYVIAVSD